ncbi:MAG TPA: exosortase, partial [Burkholderiales bacterium]
MKLETEAVLLRRDAGSRSALLCVGLAIAAILLLYRDTALSMVAIWRSSDTYAHGFLIVPISLYLIWRYGPDLTKLRAAPDALGFLLLGAAGLVWLTATAAQVQVLQQYAMTAMVPAAALAILGRRVAWSMAFPLLFLLLAVPFGEAFLPYLMSWTADFTVAALRLTGIPVYREGT